MICLSIAGAFVAGVHYFAIDLPQQKAVTAPANEIDVGCVHVCNQNFFSCENSCVGAYCNNEQCMDDLTACETQCGL